MTHQFPLHSNRCVGLVKPRAIAVPERLPADSERDAHRFGSFPDVLLLDFLLMVWPIRRRIGKEPALFGRVPDDIGPMIAVLLSDDNRWVNGQRIEVSGGMAL